MLSLDSDLVILAFDPEELFRLCLTSKHFRHILDNNNTIEKLLTLHLPQGYALPTPPTQGFFLTTNFGRFISAYDTLTITKRVSYYYPSLYMAEALRPVLLSAAGYNHH